MRYDPAHKAQTRARVLAEAAAAIRRDGPDRVGVAAVMNGAGLTHGAFYAHFASRDSLLAETVDFMFAGLGTAYFVDLDGLEPKAALERYVAFYLSITHRNSRDTGCPVPTLAGSLHQLPEDARTRFAAAVDRMRGRVSDLLRRAGSDDVDARAASAVAEMVGAVALARVTADDDAAETLLSYARRSVRRKFGLDAASATEPG